MSVPNVRPEHDGTVGLVFGDAYRRGNPSFVYRDDESTDDIRAATTRARTVSHRFGGVRYALTRKGAARRQGTVTDDGGEPLAGH